VGKSTLVLDIFETYMALDDITDYASARSDPKTFVDGLKKPAVIDEIQKMPETLSPAAGRRRTIIFIYYLAYT
jgi:hypothetical protein